ncbi:MAG TPA: homoserine dehydrogenase [Geminicoccus sp.]|jgi:homoserine dehydrogenase|uniref:homoserine dehydrogenase n=1 Tax=Geminicoccus sp. TaxID=2024832 RepID=UPI002E32EFAC|nr:homoserine dehydrogenase [Geminicoccus sp.]HEX2528723.1 homoserine dehydrogenase [Geminicoccus sp.]
MSSLKIGIAGLGTVGAATAAVIEENASVIARRTGRTLEVVAVSARERRKDRGIPLDRYRWYENAAELAVDPEIDLVCELIGGSDGVALEVVRTALAAGKHVVTANKALLAHQGATLAGLAEQQGVSLAFEAAVAGGIPIVKALREGLAANRIRRITGILNGTSNYILTTMRETGRDFASVLAEAQEKGYAEADPSFDVDGVDAAHKLCLLASLAYGCLPRFDAMRPEGIRGIKPVDIAFAGQLGFRIKLLGSARLTEAGLVLRMHPAMVPLSAPIAAVEGVFNGITVEGDRVGVAVFEGRGAGAGPTASAVVADIIDIARGLRLPTFGVPASELADRPMAPVEDLIGSYYLRLEVVDRPGVLADVAAVLRDQHVSIESLIQRGRDPEQPVTLVITTHDATEGAMSRALATIAGLPVVLEAPTMIRIEQA